MPDNPFENKVKQKLDELNFSPSNAVWQKVEEQIKKDKKRRGLLLWLPLWCLLLGGGVWFYLPGKSKPDRGNKLSVLLNSPAAFSKKTTPVSGETKGSGGNLKPQGIVKSNTLIQPDGLAETRHRPGKTAIEKTAKQTNTATANQENNTSITAENDQSRIENESLNSRHADKDMHKPGAEKNSYQNAPATTSAIQKESTSGKPAAADSLKASGKKKITNTRKNRLEWGITGGAGLSSLSMHLSPESYPYNAASAGAIRYAAYPSHKQSLSFQLGFLLLKPLNKTTDIFIGVQYTYAGIKIERGNQVNMAIFTSPASNISTYYGPNNTGSYNFTNQYHFIEIPLGIEKQLGDKSRFSLNAGVSVAMLISTNALQYIPQTGIYYKDNSYFNETQINIFGGIQYQLLRKEKYSLKLGPQVQYGLTGLVNKKSPYSEHLFIGGLKLVLSPNKK